MASKYYENIKRQDIVNAETGEVIQSIMNTTDVFR